MRKIAEMLMQIGFQGFLLKLAEMLAGRGFQGFLSLLPNKSNENERIVSEALERLTQDRTTFLISHNLRAVEQADQILYIEAGTVVERGTHSELIKHDGKYAHLYRLQTTQMQEPETSQSHKGNHHAA